MTDVSKLLLTRDLQSIVNFCGNIEVSHFLKIVVPSVIVRDRPLVSLAVLIATGVTKPDIITRTSNLECRRNL